MGGGGLEAHAAETASTASVTKAALTSDDGSSTITDADGFRLSLDWLLPAPHETTAQLVVDLSAYPELEFASSSRAFTMVASTGDEDVVELGSCVITSGDQEQLQCEMSNTEYLAEYTGDVSGQVWLSGTMNRGNETEARQTYTFGGQSTEEITILPTPERSTSSYGGQSNVATSPRGTQAVRPLNGF